MVRSRFDELWKAPTNNYLIVVHSCSMITPAGELVIGQGSARQALELYPHYPRMAVKKILEKYPGICLDGTEDYGFIEVIEPILGLGIFQTRRDYNRAIVIESIQKSAAVLAEYAAAHPTTHIRLPRPFSTGKGYAEKNARIEEILGVLPDNVHVIQWR